MYLCVCVCVRERERGVFGDGFSDMARWPNSLKRLRWTTVFTS